MKIVLASPLYPPDIAEPAPYIKELASQLVKSPNNHSVTIVTYGHIPEKVSGVTIVTISKHRPRLMRVGIYFFVLFKIAIRADVLFVENGASVELPALLASFILRTKLIIHTGDRLAATRATTNTKLGAIDRLARKQASHIITDIPLERPEILPFTPADPNAMNAYASSWQTHVAAIERIF